MSCSICMQEARTFAKPSNNNDCIINYLDKIRTHYISFRRKLNDNELTIEKLQREKHDLEARLRAALSAAESPKRRKTISSGGSPLLDRTNLFGKGAVLAEHSTDDLNMALNTETMLSSQDVTPDNVSKTRFKKLLSSNENWKGKSKKEAWGMSFVQPNLADSKKLSLRPDRLKQSRLEFEYKKGADVSMDESVVEDSADEEVVQATPKHSSRANRSKTIRSLIMRKQNENSTKENADDVFNFSKSPSALGIQPRSPNETCLTNDEPDDCASLFIVSPEKEVVCVDDDTTELNIDTADLLNDMMNKNESGRFLHYLRKVESDRIKQLQKKPRTPPKAKIIVKQEKITPKKTQKVTSPSNLEDKMPLPFQMKEEANKTQITQSSEEIFPLPIQIKEEPRRTPMKKQKTKRERLFSIECDDCQKFLNNLGANMTDDEIERRLRNCSRHNRPVFINPTPDGFWDPFIEPLDKDDPRNVTLIDNRFVGMRNKK